MSALRKLGTVLISFSLATLSGLLISDLGSAYHGASIPFDQSVYVMYFTHLRNRETSILMDLKGNSTVGLIIMDQEQIHALLLNNVVLYSAYFNFTGGLSRGLGRLDQGLYAFAFDSADRKQVVRLQLVQSGLEFDSAILGMALLSLGLIFVFLPLLLGRFLSKART